MNSTYETTQAVVATKVELHCSLCGGTMYYEPMLKDDPLVHLHVCEECGAEVFTQRVYPYIRG